MDRATRLRSLWSWLPDFRIVAETEHLPTASGALHVSASSLSRTIRLLEDDVGRPLFDRVGRGIVLNDAGRELLAAVRVAMRGVDEALARLGPGRFVGEVRVSVAGPWAPLTVLPALGGLAAAHPELTVRISSLPAPRIEPALVRGRIDVAILEQPTPREGVAITPLHEVPHAVFCGPGHPLFDRRRPSAAELRGHPFVAPVPGDDGRIPDRWPPERPRRVGLLVQQMQVQVDACASGAFLAVLPVPVADRAGLRRLTVRGIGSSTLYAAHRTTLVPDGRAEALVGAIRDALDD